MRNFLDYIRELTDKEGYRDKSQIEFFIKQIRVDDKGMVCLGLLERILIDGTLDVENNVYHKKIEIGENNLFHIISNSDKLTSEDVDEIVNNFIDVLQIIPTNNISYCPVCEYIMALDDQLAIWHGGNYNCNIKILDIFKY